MNRLQYLAIVAILTSTAGADWLRFRGDSTNTAPGEKPPTRWNVETGENVAWRAELPGRGTSSPIVVGGKVIVTASSGPRRTDTVKAPLFPGYLFVFMDVAKTRWRAIRSTIGIRHLICEGEKPLAVPPGVVEDIRAQEDVSGLVPVAPPFRPGEEVRVTDGALREQVGWFQRVADRDRVVILLSLVTLPVVVGCSALIYYYLRYSVLVERRLHGERWMIPARLYSRPLILRPGLTLTPAGLSKILNGLKYTQRNDVPSAAGPRSSASGTSRRPSLPTPSCDDRQHDPLRFCDRSRRQP